MKRCVKWNKIEPRVRRRAILERSGVECHFGAIEVAPSAILVPQQSSKKKDRYRPADIPTKDNLVYPRSTDVPKWH